VYEGLLQLENYIDRQLFSPCWLRSRKWPVSELCGYKVGRPGNLARDNFTNVIDVGVLTDPEGSTAPSLSRRSICSAPRLLIQRL
jgi:hypothetical protein